MLILGYSVGSTFGCGAGAGAGAEIFRFVGAEANNQIYALAPAVDMK